MSRFFHNTLLFSVLLLLALNVAAQDKNALQKKRDELNKQIQLTNQLIGDTEKSQKTTQSQLGLINSKIQYRKELIGTINSEIREINQKITENNALVESLEEDLARLKKEYADMIYRAYVNRNPYDKLLYIFSADDFYQAIKRSRYLSQYAKYRERQAELIEKTTEKLNTKLAELQVQKEEKNELLKSEKSEQDKLAADRNKQQSALASLKQESKKLKKTLDQQQKERNKLNKEIQRIIEAEIAASKKDNKGAFVLTPEAAELSANFESNKGKLPWPVERGVITGTFGKHKHPVLPGITIENNGIDITTTKGEKVRSVFKGTVTSVFTIPGAGKNIIISHGAYRTVYTNLLEVYVTTGETVDTKQAIGVLMTDEEDKKTVAHLEIWKISSAGTTKQNPASWIYQK
jgi:septal ring factor EnvC (AmiA/AmiB activator)